MARMSSSAVSFQRYFTDSVSSPLRVRLPVTAQAACQAGDERDFLLSASLNSGLTRPGPAAADVSLHLPSPCGRRISGIGMLEHAIYGRASRRDGSFFPAPLR